MGISAGRKARADADRHDVCRPASLAIGLVAIVLVVAACRTGSDSAPPSSTTGTGPPRPVTCVVDDAGTTRSLDELLLSDPPAGYVAGPSRSLDEETFLREIAQEGRATFQRTFDRDGFVGAYERKWLPADGPHPGRNNEDMIFGYAVCLANGDGAHDYATSGMGSTVPNGTWVPLPFPDARLTRVRDDHAATALLRTGNAVVTFTQWSDDGHADDQALTTMARSQLARAGKP